MVTEVISNDFHFYHTFRLSDHGQQNNPRLRKVAVPTDGLSPRRAPLSHLCAISAILWLSQLTCKPLIRCPQCHDPPRYMICPRSERCHQDRSALSITDCILATSFSLKVFLAV